MAVQFILGRSGTGKTRLCTEEIISALNNEGDRQLIYLVPEQATYQAERSILCDGRVDGYSRLSVLSFERLGFMLGGKGRGRFCLSRAGRRMLVGALLRRHRSELQVLKGSALQNGLAGGISDVISEFCRYAKGPDEVDELLAQLTGDDSNKLSSMKFADIGLIYREYTQAVEQNFLDPDNELNLAKDAVKNAKWMRRARLWIDGFAGFTGTELEILAEMLKVCDDSKIALCLDPQAIDVNNFRREDVDVASLFYPTERTYGSLLEVIKRSGLERQEPVLLDEPARFSKASDLRHIEKDLFRYGSAKQKCSGQVKLAAAGDIRSEVRFTAREIVELVRDKGWRYRDIAVVASDLGSYEHYIRAYFEDYGIPFFIDQPKAMSSHPAAELLCGALKMVCDGFDLGDISAYLKTQLLPADNCELEQLENYCVAFGIRDKDFSADGNWDYDDPKHGVFDEELINRVRREVVEPLLELKAILSPNAQTGKRIAAAEFVRVVFDFIEKLGVIGRLDEWTREAHDAGDVETAAEHGQFYTRLVDIFDEMCEVLGDEKLSCTEYLEMLSNAFGHLNMAFIPPRLDQVLVGSIERSRHPDLRAVFLMGATQKQFPVPLNSGGVLSDDDRQLAESADFELGPTVSQSLSERQYLTYIAFTRASEYLCISRPLADASGAALCKSQFVAELQGLFEGLDEQIVDESRIKIAKINTAHELSEELCNSLEDGKEVFERICGDKELNACCDIVKSAIDYDNKATLETEIVKRIFTFPMRSSVTQLQMFASCPYRYFANYTLGLKKRQEFKFEAPDLGNFYHEVLDRLVKNLNKQGKDIAEIDCQELLKLADEEAAKVVTSDGFVANFVNHRQHNAFIIRNAIERLERCVLAVQQSIQAGSSRPAFSELSFGQASDLLSELCIKTAGGGDLVLRGKIDRLDICQTNGKKIAVVFDYKRSGKKFEWQNFYYGLDIQLPIYLLAIQNAISKNLDVDEAAGAFYFPIEVSATSGDIGDVEKGGKFGYKAYGVFNGQYHESLDENANGWSRYYNYRVTKKDDQYGDYNKSGVLRPAGFKKLMAFAEAKAVELADRIAAGEITVKPYQAGTAKPCSYCDYKALCRYDWKINETNYLAPVSKEMVVGNSEGTDECE